MDVSVLYHYTSVDTFFKILEVGLKENPNKICLRATHAHFMKDPFEYDYALSILKESMIKYEEINNIDARKSDYLFEKKNFFSWISRIGGEPYLLSFSEHADDLSMWRGYGKDGTGLSIGLDLNELKQYCNEKGIYNTSIIKCNYAHDIVISDLIKYWDKEYKNFKIEEDSNQVGLNDLGSLILSIPNLCFQAKSKAYLMEKEWRLCKNEYNEKNVEFDVRGNLIVPFVKHLFDISIIKKIIIGPSSNFELVEKGLRLFLEKLNFYNKGLVERSEISYRQL